MEHAVNMDVAVVLLVWFFGSLALFAFYLWFLKVWFGWKAQIAARHAGSASPSSVDGLGASRAAPVLLSCRVVVNRDLSLADMIAAGRYNWTNNDITADHFPIAGSGITETEITLVHFNRAMSTNAVLEELDRRGFRAATIEELLALGAKHPDLQLEFPIVALGSLWQRPLGGRECPRLGGGGSHRLLNLGGVEHDRHAICRFAAVRK